MTARSLSQITGACASLAMASLCGATDYDWQLRQEFDGKYNQTRPARAFYQNSEDSPSYYAIDAAVASEFGWNPTCGKLGSCDTDLKLVAECHRSSAESSPTRKLSLGVDSSAMLGTPRSDLNDRNGHALVAVMSGYAKASRNSLNHDDEYQAGVFVSPYSNVGYLFPGAVRNHREQRKSRGILISWLPSLGIEEFGSMTIAGQPDDGDLTTVTARVGLAYWPFPHGDEDWARFELTVDGSHYQRLGGSDVLGSNFQVFDVGINFYFDAKERAGLGIDYQQGFSADDNFEHVKKFTVGFKAKLGQGVH